jgi:hypothetical protein
MLHSCIIILFVCSLLDTARIQAPSSAVTPPPLPPNEYKYANKQGETQEFIKHAEASTQCSITAFCVLRETLVCSA